MTTATGNAPGLVGPAVPRSTTARHRPLDLRSVRLTPDGGLGAWQRRNAEATIPHCIEQLETSGVLENFRRVIGESDAPYRGFVFADSDLYKVIEAVAWEIGRSGTGRFDSWLDEVITLVARTQDNSGYVMTWVQRDHPDKRFAELDWTHELYVLGHMVQAAIALDRAAGRSDLLAIGRRFVDLLHTEFGPNGRDAICGHPEIETALIELFRHTGDHRALELATRMINLRGHGLIKVGNLGPQYFQDHLPVREADAAIGHAVRQLYLNAGVTDLYLETGEPELLTAMHRQWVSAHERKMYLSGAFGSRHRDEAFGDDYELPSDRAYAETCATIADLHWNWRLLLAEGGHRYAEVIEREIHNALAASVDSSGTRFFYSNPLQLRPDRYSEENAPRERASWYSCACCPPNIARTVAQLSSYLATSTADALWLHQYADAEIDLPEHLGTGMIRIRTSYPRDGSITITLDGTLRPGVVLRLRLPSWATTARLSGQPITDSPADGYLVIKPGTAVGWELDLDLRPRLTRAHPQVDAVRGCLAVERGPVVYCVEQADLGEGAAVSDLILDPAAPISEQLQGEAGSPVLTLQCRLGPTSTRLYTDATGDTGVRAEPLTVTAIPFSTWGNRTPGAMRVWLPVIPASEPT